MEPYVAPSTDIEAGLVKIWCEVLRLKQVGVQDNFFDVGGHSLLAVQVISRIRRNFDVEVSVRSIFEEPVIARLAETVARAQADGVKAKRPIMTKQTPVDGKDMLIAQLDKLSPEEIRALLERYQERGSPGHKVDDEDRAVN